MHTRQPATPRRRSVFHRLVRILAKVILTVIIILIIVIFLIQTPYIQNIARSKAEKYLSRKLNTRVNIGHLYIDFPRTVILNNVYIEDRQKDTLLSAGLINVNIRMWGLLHNDIDVRAVQLADLTIKVKRQLPDTAFNFQFVADAFAGAPSAKPPTTTSKPMKMELNELLLDKIRLVYKDTVTGNDMEVWIDHSLTKMKEFDPTALRFNVSSFECKGLRGRIWQEQPLIRPAVVVAAAGSDTSSSRFLLQLGKIDLQSTSLDYRNTPGALYVNLQLGRLLTEVQTFDLAGQTIGLKELNLDSTTTVLRLGKTAPAGPATHNSKADRTAAIAPTAKTRAQASTAGASASSADPALAGATPGWHFRVASLRLNGNNFQFDDDNQRRQPAGMDYAHLNIQQLTLHGSSLSYTADSAAGTLTKGSLTEQSGFRLTRLQTRFLYSNHQSWLQDLILQTPGTLLQRSAVIKYPSLAGMMKDPVHTLIDLDLTDSRVQVKDILTFVPSLHTQPVFQHPGDTWVLNTRIKGSLDALTIQTLQFSGIRDIRVDLAGTLLHPMDANNIRGDLNIRHLSGSRDALTALLPKGTLPSNIDIPAHFDLSGKINGGMQGFQSDLAINTSSGNLLVKGFVRQFRQPRQATYDLVLHTTALDLGYILKDSAQYGRFTSGFTVKGQGLDLNSANATFTGRVDSAIFHRYTYHDLSLDGSIAGRQAQLHSAIQNTAVHFELQASADLTRKFPALKLDWQIDTLDLHALNFVKDTLQFKGHVSADFADTNPDSLQGNLRLAKLIVVQGAQRFSTDSILLLASRKEDIEDIQLHSEMADIDWNGRYKLTETAQALRHTISQYYHLDNATAGTIAHQDWTFRANFRVSPLVLAYMPSLQGTDSLGAFIAFNSDHNDLHAALKDPHIHFGSQELQQLDITAATTGAGANGRLNYTVKIAGGNGSGFELHQTSLSGSLHNDQLFTDLLLKDAKGKDRYRVAGQLDKLRDGLKFMLNADSLLLNYDTWQVSRDNYLQYDSSGIVVHHFIISHGDESLSVNSNPPAPASPIDVSFANFRVGTLSRFAEQDSLSLDGLLNGKAQIKNILSTPIFTSDLVIKGLSYKTDTLGDLAVKVNNEKANAFAADISLEGNKNDIKVKGEYFTGESRMNLNLALNQLNLKTFNQVAAGEVRDMNGFLKGQLAISGTMNQPLIKGSLHFDSARITPVVSGEPLTLSKDNIEFDQDGFNFSEFALQDSARNKLTVDGNVYTHDYRKFSFDISVNAKNFRLVNAPEASGRQFYGTLNMDAAANLTGSMDDLKVDGDIRVNRNTNFYFVLPGNDPEVVDRLGVVRFIDKAHPGDTLVDKSAQAMRARNTTIKGMDIALNLQTDSNAVFTMVIDERTGDALNVRGRSNLVFGMDKSGKTDLTGSYEVESGSYNLSLDVVKRKFAIQRGSIITWTGDPKTATLDLTADYTANTPSIDLIANEVAGRPQTDINKFKQKLPFLVTLKMEGELMKPKITFDISLPPNVLTLWPDVDQKLQQIRNEESELNKQVFALLLLNRFVGEDPLQSQAGGGATLSNIAFQSASQILTNQLDNLAASLIKGVDIHFDLNNQQDFSTGTEQDYTELNVSVSKRLFNDRISVSVGSNFDVQGTNNPGQSASNLAGDVAVDYRLTKDGRYMVRAYRKNQYEAVVEGQVVETGVSFILTFDYDKFRELFGRTKEEQLQERKVTRPSGTGPAPAGTRPAGATNGPSTTNGKTSTTTEPPTTGKPTNQ